MLEEDIKVNWYYFCSLAKQLHITEQYVDHSIDSSGNIINGLAFSNEFAKLLMLSVIDNYLLFLSAVGEPTLIISQEVFSFHN